MIARPPRPALAGALHLAQATAGDVIGWVTTAAGAASVERVDGSVATLVTGSEIHQGDTVTTGSAGALAITFVDGTVFALGADATMTIDQLVYDPSSGAAAAAFDLIEGTFVFVAGAIAETSADAMAISTPVATIGVRGTAIAVRIGDGTTDTAISLLPDPDGHLGRAVIANAAASVVLDESGETTLVADADVPPLRPEIFDAETLVLLYSQVLAVLGLGLGDDAVDANHADDVVTDGPEALALDDDLYGAHHATKVTFDPADDTAIVFTVLAPPEPTFVSLFGLGIGVLGVISAPNLPSFLVIVIDGRVVLLPIDDENFIFGTVADDTLVGTNGIDEIFGLSGADTLIGGGNDDELFGGGGDDVLDGGAGDDLMLGGPGDDLYFANNPDDDVSEDPGEGFDTIAAIGDVVVLPNVEEVVLLGTGDSIVAGFASTTPITVIGNSGANIIVRGSADDRISGNDGNDTLVGFIGDDVMFGGNGDDSLFGGEGIDVQFGGAGADRFGFAEAKEFAVVAANGPAGAAARDLLADFVAGIDGISFTPASVPGLDLGTMIEGVAFSTIAAAFNGTNAGANAAHTAGEAALVFSVADKTLYFDANGDGAGYSVVAAVAAGVIAAGDVVVAVVV